MTTHPTHKTFFIVPLIAGRCLVTKYTPSIKSVKLKEYFGREFNPKSCSDALSPRELDLILTYSMKGITDPQILEENITVGEAIDRMRKEAAAH